MNLNFQRKNTILIINIKGEIDHHTAKEIREEIEKEFKKINGRHMVFSFRDVSFMDSSGIGMMIGRYKKTLSLGGQTVIVDANEKIKQIFTISGLFKIIPYFDTIAEAIDELEGRNSRAV